MFNTDQGSQFTAEAFTKIQAEHDIRTSMDGKGSYKDNLFIERLWRTLKYEEVYLKAYSASTITSALTSRWATGPPLKSMLELWNQSMEVWYNPHHQQQDPTLS